VLQRIERADHVPDVTSAGANAESHTDADPNAHPVPTPTPTPVPPSDPTSHEPLSGSTLILDSPMS
jgi:hypothetical protein